MISVAKTSDSNIYHANNGDIDGTIGVCMNVYRGKIYDPKSAVYDLNPASYASFLSEKKDFGMDLMSFIDSAKTSILKNPDHGKLIGTGNEINYYPFEDYVGKDSVEFLVEIGGFRIKVIYSIRVGMTECPKSYWQISNMKPTAVGNRLDLSGYTLVGTMIQFADLQGHSLGETKGNVITLDLNAAGHGWYFDWQGPGDDWLPTSNPYEWMARPGSAAEGRMDFLSVFMHEYGYALGL